jgi:hypothetical protein
VSLVVVTVGVDDGDFDVVYQPDRVDSDFAVLKAVVYALDGRPIKNSNGI